MLLKIIWCVDENKYILRIYHESYLNNLARLHYL